MEYVKLFSNKLKLYILTSFLGRFLLFLVLFLKFADTNGGRPISSPRSLVVSVTGSGFLPFFFFLALLRTET